MVGIDLLYDKGVLIFYGKAYSAPLVRYKEPLAELMQDIVLGNLRPLIGQGRSRSLVLNADAAERALDEGVLLLDKVGVGIGGDKPTRITSE